MRVVALCYEILGINHELDIIRKGGVVAGKILDKIFILDRKHRIKDRLIAAGSFAYRQIYKQINKVQDEMQEEPVTGRPDGRRGPAEDTGRPGERRGRAPDGERGPPGERRRPPPEGGPRNRRPPDTARDTFPMR